VKEAVVAIALRAQIRPSPRSRPGPRVRLGGVLWLLALVFFAGQVVAQAAFVPAYSLLDDRISDLGNTTCGPWLTRAYACSPLHAVMNAALVATGVVILLGTLLTWPAWPPRRLTAWGLTSLALAGLGFVVVGLAPENVSLGLHLLGATNLLTSNLALLLLGLAIWRSHRRAAALALALGGIGFLGLLGGPLLLRTVGHGGGLAERMVLYPVVVWVAGMGAAFLRWSDDAPRGPQGADRPSEG
jgi:hypothetical membrane protein